MFADAKYYTQDFQCVYSHFNDLGLINEDNFKILCALSENILSKLLSVIKEPEKLPSFEQMECLKPFISIVSFDLIKKINLAIPLSNKEFIALAVVPSTRLASLGQIVRNLAANKLLTRETYRQAFERIFAKIPSVKISETNKQSRRIKENNLTHSHLSLTNSVGFFIEHNEKKQYLEGSIGKVKKGYPSVPNDDKIAATYSLKKYTEREESAEYALKNAKYEILLGRKSWFFKRESSYSVVSEWQEGKPLHEITNTELLSIPLINRFSCLIHALSQLEILHKNQRTHNDLTPGNFIANFHKNTMALIDFDKVTKAVGADYHDEMEALTAIIKRLFPEIAFQEEHDDNKKPLEYAIFLFVSALSNENPGQRCTTKDSLDYCQTILLKQNSPFDLTFDRNLIKAIAGETIFRKTIGLEDILRGKTQSPSSCL